MWSSIGEPVDEQTLGELKLIRRPHHVYFGLTLCIPFGHYVGAGEHTMFCLTKTRMSRPRQLSQVSRDSLCTNPACQVGGFGYAHMIHGISFLTLWCNPMGTPPSASAYLPSSDQCFSLTRRTALTIGMLNDFVTANLSF